MTQNFVYRWIDTNPASKHKYYIGLHKGSEDDGYITSSQYFMEQYKLRPNDFVREILQTFETYDEAHEYETRLLTEADAAGDPLYYNKHNNTPGRYHNKGHTQEAKDKVSAANKGKRKGIRQTEEHRRKISEANMGHTRNKGKFQGKDNPMYGKKITEEHKKIISEANRNKIVSAETRKKMRDRVSGEKNPMYGKAITEEHREKLKAARRLIYDVTLPDGSIEVVSNMKAFAEKYGINHQVLSNYGRLGKPYKGYIVSKKS